MSHLLYFSPFTKVISHHLQMWGGIGGVQGGFSPLGQRRGKNLRGRKVGPQGESGVPGGEEIVLPPNSACFHLNGPDPNVGVVWGGTAPPGTRAPAPWIHCCCFHCRQLWAAPGQVWVAGMTSDSRWRKAPQWMRGAERSLVMVGRSLTVAKGFVPLAVGRGRSEKGQVPN